MPDFEVTMFGGTRHNYGPFVVQADDPGTAHAIAYESVQMLKRAGIWNRPVPDVGDITVRLAVRHNGQYLAVGIPKGDLVLAMATYLAFPCDDMLMASIKLCAEREGMNVRDQQKLAADAGLIAESYALWAHDRPGTHIARLDIPKVAE